MGSTKRIMILITQGMAIAELNNVLNIVNYILVSSFASVFHGTISDFVGKKDGK